MLLRDDVIRAYRLILGREPESEDAITHHLKAGSVSALRVNLLRSAEFRAKWPAIQAQSLNHEIDLDRTLTVFVHIPKCAGTTLHTILSAHADNKTCPERHNGLCNWPVGMLGGYTFFSGHYDLPSLALIPGGKRRMVSMFREPHTRLISLYRFLRAHTEEVVRRSGQNMGLVRLARALEPTDFFRHPDLARHPSINNSCVRQLTGALPQKRWEAYFPGRTYPRTLVDSAPETALDKAIATMAGMTAFGVQEEMDTSISRICAALDVAPPKEVPRHQAHDVITAANPLLEPVPPIDLDPGLRQALAPHVTLDSRLYQEAVRSFMRTSA